jgi:hypothetical protein
LVSPAGPRRAQRAPLGTTGCLFQQEQAAATLGRPYKRRPPFLQPSQALGRIAMVGHQARLLQRKPHVVEQRPDILAGGEHAALAPAQHPDADRVPTGRLTAAAAWPGLSALDAAFVLLGGQLRSAPTARAGAEAIQAVQPQSLWPVVEAGSTAAPTCGQPRDGHVRPQEVEHHREPSHQAYIVFEVSLWQPGVEGFDSRSTALYPEAHGCLLLDSCDRKIDGEIHPFAHGDQPKFPIHFLNIYSSSRLLDSRHSAQWVRHGSLRIFCPFSTHWKLG